MPSEPTLAALRDKYLLDPIRDATLDFYSYWRDGGDNILESDIQAIAARLLIKKNIICAREISYAEWLPHSPLVFDWVMETHNELPRTPVEIKVLRDKHEPKEYWKDVEKVRACKPNLANNRARPVCIAVIAEWEHKDADHLKLYYEAEKKSRFGDTIQLIFSDSWKAGEHTWNWFLAFARHL